MVNQQLNAIYTQTNQRLQFGETDTILPIFIAQDENIVLESNTATIYQVAINNSFTLDHTGTALDSTTVVLDGVKTSTLHYVINDKIDGFYKFSDHISDNYFIDVANTTATVDSNQNRFEFTSGQTVKSSIIADHKMKITVVKAEYGVTPLLFDFSFPARFGDEGEVLFEMTTDGTNLLSFNRLTFFVFTNYDGQQLKYRITESAGSNATISDLIEVQYSLGEVI